MTIIDINKTKWIGPIKTFFIKESEVPFDTNYKIVNDKTRLACDFAFSHSTGPERDPKTHWVYKAIGSDYSLHVTNS